MQLRTVAAGRYGRPDASASHVSAIAINRAINGIDPPRSLSG